MKRNLLILLISVVCIVNTINAQSMKVRGDNAIQIGFNSYKYLTFGIDLNGKYSIEHDGSGLNFWKPYPTANAGNYILFLRDDKKVGIGSSGSSSYKLDIAGTTRSWGYYTYSDERLKTNIVPIKNSLNKVLQLEAVSYIYNFSLDKYSKTSSEDLDEIKRNTIAVDNKIDSDNKEHIGFVAQDLEQILPQAVIEDEKGYLSINYNEIIPLLVGSIKEQQERIDNLENMILDLTQSKSSTKSISENSDSNQNPNNTNSCLYNNFPNPLKTKTTIKYYISKQDLGGKNYLVVYNQNGVEVRRIILQSNEGNGQIEFSINELENGIYVYSFILDEVQIDSKTMIISK